MRTMSSRRRRTRGRRPGVISSASCLGEDWHRVQQRELGNARALQGEKRQQATERQRLFPRAHLAQA